MNIEQSKRSEEQKQDDLENNGDTSSRSRPIVYSQDGLGGATGRDGYRTGLSRSNAGRSGPRLEPDDDDVTRSVGTMLGHRRDLMVHDDDAPKSAGPVFEDDDPTRKVVGLSGDWVGDSYHNTVRSGAVMGYDPKKGMGLLMVQPAMHKGIQLAPHAQGYPGYTDGLGKSLPLVEKQFGDQTWIQNQQRLLDEYAGYDDDLQADESDDMMMEEEEVIYNAEGIPALPSYYRRDSTYRSQKGGMFTVNSIQQVLEQVRQSTQCYMDFRAVGPKNTEIEGEFHSNRAICEFVISTYSGSDTDQQIWVEFRNLSTGIDAAQAYATLFHEVTKGLFERDVITELVDPSFQPYCAMEDPPRVDEEEARVDDEEVKIVLQDRFRELKASNYLMNQRALTEEIMYVAEDYASLVAEIPGVAKQLATLLKKNAKQDSQVSKTVLNLVRVLLPFDYFVVELKKEAKKLTQAMIEAAESTNSAAWQRDIVDTVQALQKVGIQCNSKKFNTIYRRIQGQL